MIVLACWKLPPHIGDGDQGYCEASGPFLRSSDWEPRDVCWAQAPVMGDEHLWRVQDCCWYFVTSRINPQAHGYRCSFHPRVFQGIVSTGEHEYTIHGFMLYKDTHTDVGG